MIQEIQEIATDCTSNQAHKHLTFLFSFIIGVKKKKKKKSFIIHVLIRKTRLMEQHLLVLYDYFFKVEKDV